MTFEEFILELEKEWPTTLLVFAIFLGFTVFRLRMKTKMSEMLDADGKKIQEQLKELLKKYGNNDFVYLEGLTYPVITIGEQFVVRIEPQEYELLTEYLFRPRFKYALVYNYKNRVKGQIIGIYTDLEKLAHDYVKVKKDFQEKEKLQKVQEDF